jgi:hypothetical protein
MSIVIGELSKNSAERIRVSTNSYKGHRFLDIRVHVKGDSGDWIPTKKGVTIPPDKVGELEKLLQEGKEKLNVTRGR